MLLSGFRFLDRDNPADPLVAREGRNILPFRERGSIRNENLSQIRGYAVYRAMGDCFPGHGFILHGQASRLGDPGRCRNWPRRSGDGDGFLEKSTARRRALVIEAVADHVRFHME